MIKVPHLVQYQGSKRGLAPQILRHMPRHFRRLLEPFSGTAAISLAVAAENRAEAYVINDINAPLIALLYEAVEHPEILARDYARVWMGQFSQDDDPIHHYYDVRDRFNHGEQTPANLLYLLARCVKGSVRYGRNGNFNQSPDKRRHGTKPSTLAANIKAISRLLKGRVQFSSLDYHAILDMAEPGDLVYLDPPYQGVSQARDNRYLSGVTFEAFAEALHVLDRNGIDYLVSYDGTCGDKTYGHALPESLRCRKVLLNAGRSSQATLLGKQDVTFEALYISDSLVACQMCLPSGTYHQEELAL